MKPKRVLYGNGLVYEQKDDESGWKMNTVLPYLDPKTRPSGKMQATIREEDLVIAVNCGLEPMGASMNATRVVWGPLYCWKDFVLAWGKKMDEQQMADILVNSFSTAMEEA